MWVRGYSRSFKLVLFKSLGSVSYSPTMVTMALSCIICEIKRDIGRKSWFFSYPPCIRRLHSGGSHRNIAIAFEMVPGLSDGEKNFRICITVYTQYRRVADGQTDILPLHSPRYAYASRGKKKRPVIVWEMLISVLKCPILQRWSGKVISIRNLYQGSNHQ